MRTPGPSTAEPVVNEWINPQSPLSIADRMSVSSTFSLTDTRRSKGLPIGGAAGSRVSSFMFVILRGAVKRAVDHVHLLLARQSRKVDRITGNADRERR